MNKNTVIINGSPRPNGITHKLLNKLSDNLKAKEYNVDYYSLYDLNCKPCKGCFYCHTHDTCFINDDSHNEILSKINNCEIIVMGSPVYWSNVTGVMKNFIDRTTPLFDFTKFGPTRKNLNIKKAILITSCNAPFPFSHIFKMVQGAQNAMKTFLKRMKVKQFKTLAVTSSSTLTDEKLEKIFIKVSKLV